MKQLLIVGAGINQLSLIRIAKSMGLCVHVVSPKGKYPGIEIADYWLCEDIFSRDAIVEYVKQHKINGIISDQSDMAAPIVAYVAEQTGLPTYGYQNSLRFTDKNLMRALYQELGLPVPSFREVNTPEEAAEAAESIGFPVVVKPTDSFSSRGIVRVDSAIEVRNAFISAKGNSRSGNVIVEKYIKGPQFFSQGFVSEYKYNLFAFSDRYYHSVDTAFIPYTNAFPALISDDLCNRMRQIMDYIIGYCKPRFGHVWTEWILDEETDELYIIEMAIRGAGAQVTTEIIPRAYGVDTQPYLIRAALGEDDGSFGSLQIESKGAAAFFSFLLPEGVVQTVEGLDSVASIPGVVCAEFRAVAPGDVVEKSVDKTSRYGLIVLEGKTRNDLVVTWKALQDTIRIRILSEDGQIKGPLWT